MGEPCFPVLAISGSTCNSSEFFITDLDDFSNRLGGDKVTHGGSGINGHDNSTLEDECEGGGSGFEVHDFFLVTSGLLDGLAELVGFLDGGFLDFFLDLVEGELRESVKLADELVAVSSKNIAIHFKNILNYIIGLVHLFSFIISYLPPFQDSPPSPTLSRFSSFPPSPPPASSPPRTHMNSKSTTILSSLSPPLFRSRSFHFPLANFEPYLCASAHSSPPLCPFSPFPYFPPSTFIPLLSSTPR